MNLLNQVKLVIVALILGNHIETTVEEVELVSVTSRLQVMIARVRHMLQPEVWNLIWYQDPMGCPTRWWWKQTSLELKRNIYIEDAAPSQFQGGL